MLSKSKKYLPYAQEKLKELGYDIDLTIFESINSNLKVRCPICNREMLNHNLGRHLESIHIKEKPFKCEYCDFRTSVKHNLNKHSCYAGYGTRTQHYSIETTIQTRMVNEYEKSNILINSEVRNIMGRIDILTNTEVIEIKRWTHRNTGVGQLKLYSTEYPDKLLRLHIYGRKLINQKLVDNFVKACKQLDIIVSFEDENSEHY